MTPQELRERTREFTVRVIKFCRTLPSTTEGLELGRSRTEFAARLGIVLEESDEAEGWLAMACDLDIGDLAEAKTLKAEAEQLCAIFGRACQTARRQRSRDSR